MLHSVAYTCGLPRQLGGKKFTRQCRRWRDMGLIPGSGRSPAGRKGNPLQYSYLEKSHGRRSLAGYSPWGCKNSHTRLRQLSMHGEGRGRLSVPPFPRRPLFSSTRTQVAKPPQLLLVVAFGIDAGCDCPYFQLTYCPADLIFHPCCPPARWLH